MKTDTFTSNGRYNVLPNFKLSNDCPLTFMCPKLYKNVKWISLWET